MIYTVTFNPSLDYILSLDQFHVGAVNRTSSERMHPGGKGINVSMVLKNLGVENTALGFLAGFTGKEIEARVQAFGCETRFIHVKKGCSRINVKIRAEKESEINATGPAIGNEEIEMLMKQVEELKQGDMLVLAGSIPKSLPDTIYMDILERLAGKEICTVVDATGSLLAKVLKYHPFLIKPNNYEMEEVFGVKIETDEELILYGKRMMEMGARNVLISKAGDGAILLAEDGQIYQSPAPEGQVINSVGAGDSMVAGFLAGYMNSKNYEQALKMGIATGSASAFSENLATKDEVLLLLEQLEEKDRR